MSLVIFLISLVSRTLAITASLNTDEGLWIYRGSQFIKRLFEGDLTHTILKHHPGVPNMWLTGSGMLANCWLNKFFPGFLGVDLPPDIGACLNLEQFPINLYIIPRLVQAVVTSACMVCIYLLIKRLLGQAIAFCTIILLLLEPFFLAYQRFITTDALQADFAILAVLLFLLYLQKDRGRKFILASGVFLGLATAAKITALFLLPAIAIIIGLIELGVWQDTFPSRGWKQQLRGFRLWLATILVTFILIFPAMWVSPGYVLDRIRDGVLQESDRGFLFFLGQLTHSPGILFYPLVLVYRLSPILQVGLVATSLVLLIPKLRCRQKNMPAIVAIALIAIWVILILSASDNKIDRYINLCLPMLAILAAVGWLEIIAGVTRWLNKLFPLREKSLQWGYLIIFALQLVLLFPYHPYYLTYYNPLFGGAVAAQNIFMIGQGEGLEQAAQWLNQSPNVKEIKVASWYSRYFSSYFYGQVLPVDKRIPSGVQPWTQANRVVFYKNQLQRQLPEPKMLAYFAKQQPLYTVRLQNIDYAWVYPGPLALAEDVKRIQFPLSLSFGEQVRLLGYDLNQTKISTNDELIVTFYWEFLAPLPGDISIKISLRDRQNHISNFSSTPLIDGYVFPENITPGTILRDVHKLKISPSTSPQRYQLEVEGFSFKKGQVIGEVEVVK
ncbi:MULTISPECIES: glycosyltransferase family 39 protein [Fischerella]|uniref:glycosyltransferase family 39 protein n=1 Tax=Fischerella TaxID=1190 RepID=UPI000474A702|nr:MULTISPECIES: glycosyltransferase family 39 protein [Fischerella]MBD2433430.1 glycosyltransferase family 39 protein [Fischerella sp. FACHB-380]